MFNSDGKSSIFFNILPYSFAIINFFRTFAPSFQDNSLNYDDIRV